MTPLPRTGPSPARGSGVCQSYVVVAEELHFTRAALTPADRTLLARARQLLALHDETIRELRGQARSITVDIVGPDLELVREWPPVPDDAWLPQPEAVRR